MQKRLESNQPYTPPQSSGGIDNPYDPESLISGKEIAQGFTYKNSSRKWLDENHYLDAISGRLTTEEILEFAPRKLK